MSSAAPTVNRRRARPARLVLEQFRPYRLSVAANLVSAAVALAYARRHALNPAEWRVVAVLGAGSAANQQAVCDATRMDKMAVSRAVTALRRRRLVRTTASPADGRARRLALTAAGARLYADVAPRALEQEQRIFGQLAARDARAFDRLLARIDAAARAVLEADEG